MTNEEKMRAEFAEWWTKYLQQGGVTHFNITADKESAINGFQAAYQLQQTKINALMQNVESMNQTNAALIKKLDIAIEALEFYANSMLCQNDIAQQALSQLKENK